MDLYEYETIRKHLPNYPFISEVGENNRKNMHFHEELEIMRILEGEMCAVCGDKKCVAEKGDFFIFMPGEPHGFDDGFENKFSYLKALVVSKYEKHNMTNLRLKSNLVDKTSPVYKELCNIYSCIEEENKNKKSGYEFAVNQYLNRLFVLLIRSVENYEISNEDKIKQRCKNEMLETATEYIETYYAENITLDEISKICGYSKYYFSHKFNELMNMSFFDYLTKFRLEKAIEFIKNDKVNHTKAALLSGFGSARSFNRLFKKHYNLTPTEYFEKSQKNVDVAKKI